MIGVRIQDDNDRNDVWIVLEHVTAVTEVNEDTLQGIEVHLSGRGTVFINKWTVDRWTKFFDKAVRQIQIASAGGMRAQ